MYKFISKNKQCYVLNIKENANCPDSEKSSTGPGSCGGSSDKKEGPDNKPTNESGNAPKKGGFLSKIFSGGEKSSIKSISWKQARELSTDDLAKSLEEHVKIAKESKSDADKKQAMNNIKNINEVLSMRGSSGYRGNYKTTRKY